MNRKILASFSLLSLVLTVSVFADDSIRAYEIESVHGELIRMQDYQDQWVLINFWATWCKPCRKELPDLQALHEHRDNVTVIGLAFEDQPNAVVIDFLKEFNVSYPVAVVDLFEPPELFGLPEVMPTSVLINPDGEIANTWYGEKDKAGVATVELIETYIDAASSGG